MRRTASHRRWRTRRSTPRCQGNEPNSIYHRQDPTRSCRCQQRSSVVKYKDRSHGEYKNPYTTRKVKLCYKKNSRARNKNSKTVTHLQLSPRPIDPCSIVSHTVDIRERLDPSLDIASDVENTAASVHEVCHGILRVEGRRITEDGIVPAFEVWVVRDQGRESSPFVGGCDEAGTIGAEGSRAWVRGLEGVCGPGEFGVGGGVKSRGSERRCVRLTAPRQKKTK